MKSVLLFRLGGLGDLLVAFPSIYLLRKKLAPCSITLICREEYGSLLKEAGVVDNLISEGDASLAPLFAGSPYLDGELSRWLEDFSLILGWMQKKSSLQIEGSLHTQKRKKCRFFVFKPTYPGQISQFFFDITVKFLNKGATPPFNECRILPIGLSQKEEGLKMFNNRILKEDEKIVVVHPGSGSEDKCWPFRNFIKIITQLSIKGVKGVVVTGMAEGRIESDLEGAALPRSWTWLRNPPLLRLAGLLSCAHIYLGNDSGVTHLAAACGTQVVALFRKDLLAKWKPYGNVSVFSGESISDIKFDAVLEAVCVGVRPL